MAIHGRENGVYEFPYMSKQPQLTKWEAFRIGIWNPNTNAFLGRNAGSWARILFFYAIFYAVLAALFTICLTGLYATLDKDRPTYVNSESIMRGNPGLGFRPLGDVAEGAIIKYNINENTHEKYIKIMKDFIDTYNKTAPGVTDKIVSHCDYEQKPEDGRACPVPIDNFQSCNGPDFGYEGKSPCVFLKLNKIYDWVPEYYNNSKDLPGDMPKDLKTAIKLDEMNNESNKVWVNCIGENPSDKEHIVKFNYYPYRGFPSYYYPFNHTKDDYLSPLIAVEIVNVTVGVQINIECRAWAKNIEYEGGPPEHRRGCVRFEIFKEV